VIYKNVLVALDGSIFSDYAAEASIAITENEKESSLTACHVYAAKLHFDRFSAMEDGLPQHYQEEEKLIYLRNTHDALIGDGLELISDSYTKKRGETAKVKKIACRSILPEGKNFKEILRIISEQKIELTVLGAWGQGRTW